MPETPRSRNRDRDVTADDASEARASTEVSDRFEDADEIAAGLRRRVPLFGLDIEPTG